MCVYRNGEREKNFEFKFSLGTNTVEVKCFVLGAQIKSKNGFSFK